MGGQEAPRDGGGGGMSPVKFLSGLLATLLAMLLVLLALWACIAVSVQIVGLL